MSRIQCLGTTVLGFVLLLPVASSEAGFVGAGTPLKGSQAVLFAESGASSTIDDFASTTGVAANANDSGDNFTPLSQGYPLSLIGGVYLPLALAPVEPNIAPSFNVNFSPVGIMLATAAVGVVPEPGSIVLLGLGALGVLAFARRRRKPIN